SSAWSGTSRSPTRLRWSGAVSEALELARDELGPPARTRQRERLAPVRADGDPVQGPGEQRVVAFDAEGAGPLEPAPRVRGPDPRDPRQPAVEHPVDHDEAPVAERLEAEPVGNPRREPDDGLDARLVGRANRDRAAHR